LLAYDQSTFGLYIRKKVLNAISGHRQDRNVVPSGYLPNYLSLSEQKKMHKIAVAWPFSYHHQVVKAMPNPPGSSRIWIKFFLLFIVALTMIIDGNFLAQFDGLLGIIFLLVILFSSI